jgi:competence protein ComEC
VRPTSGAGPGPDLRLVPAALAAWAAAWWATASSVRVVVVAAVVVLVLAAGASAVALRRSGASLAALALAAAAVAAVLAAAGAALAPRADGRWPGWVAGRAVANLDGSLATDPQRLPPAGHGSGDRYVLTVRLAAVQARGRHQSLPVPVVVLAPASWRDLAAGQGVTFTGRLAPADPGDEAAAVVTALGPPAAVRPGSWPWRLADRVRAALRAACAGLPPDPGGLLPSLVDGDGSRLPDELRADLRTAGLTHLTAVSGANLTIIIGSLMWIAGAAGAPRPLRIVLLLATLAGFVVLARPSPSVLRAAAMGGVGVAAGALSRRQRGVPALAVAAIVLLAVDPWLARSAGFALSAAATGGLLLLTPVWAAGLTRWLPGPLAMAVAAPAAAQVACAPVLVLLQPSVSLVAVPANLVAEPAVAPATVAGVLAAGTGALGWGPASVVAHLVALVGALGTAWVALVAHRAAALPLASAPWPPGVPGALLLAVLEALAVAASLPRARAAIRALAIRGGARGLRVGLDRAAASRGALPPGGRRFLTRRRALLGVGAAVLAGATVRVTGLRPLRPPPGLPTDWSLVMADVGQGDATVLRCGSDRAVLVDAGPDPAAVDACLSRLGVRHLDLVVLTHFHADHVGGLAGALRGRTASALLVSPLAEPAENAAEVARLAATARVPVVVAVPGQQGVLGHDGWSVTWRLLTPSGPAAAPVPPETDESDVVNESSVAVVAECRGPRGAVRAVLLGDLETQGQRALAGRLAAETEALGGPVDVVKIAHHGSAKQHEALYRRLDGRVGLIGVGADNDYGHPAPSALALLGRAGLRVLRTDTSGDLAVAAFDGGGLRLRTSR